MQEVRFQHAAPIVGFFGFYPAHELRRQRGLIALTITPPRDDTPETCRRLLSTSQNVKQPGGFRRSPINAKKSKSRRDRKIKKRKKSCNQQHKLMKTRGEAKNIMEAHEWEQTSIRVQKFS